MMIYWHFHIWSHTTSHTCRPVGRIRSGHVPIVCGDCLGKLLRSILASPQFWRTLMLVCIVHCQAAAAKNQLLQFLSRFFSEGDFLMGRKKAPHCWFTFRALRALGITEIFFGSKGGYYSYRKHIQLSSRPPEAPGACLGGSQYQPVVPL